MAFWDEWRDDKFSLTFTKLLIGILTLGTIFLIVNAQINNPALVGYLVISGLIIFIAAQTEKEKRNELLQAMFFKNKHTAYAALIGGLVIGSIIGLSSRGGSFSFILPVQSLFIGDLNFVFVNIVAPVLEPLFWRGFVFPTALAIFVGIVGKQRFPVALALALVVSGLSFGIYHINVYFGQTGTFADTYGLLTIASTFAIIFILANQVAQAISLEIGWHFANNMFSMGYPVDQIWPTMILFFVGMAILIEVSSRISRNGGS
jgi:hypothetical protein